MSGNRYGAAKAAALYLGMNLSDYMAKLDSGQKWCIGCKTWQDRDQFGRDASRQDGLAAACSEWRRRKSKCVQVPVPARLVRINLVGAVVAGHKRRLIDKRRPRVSKLGLFFTPTRDGDKLQARFRVNHRIKTGLIPSPNALPCFDCGHVWGEGERRHEYDHHLGYGAEHQLDVQAVCSKCHGVRTRVRGELKQMRGPKGRYVEKNHV